jgi:hypothetical protein
MTLVILVVLLVALAIASARFGVDTRDFGDWRRLDN